MHKLTWLELVGICHPAAALAVVEDAVGCSKLQKLKVDQHAPVPGSEPGSRWEPSCLLGAACSGSIQEVSLCVSTIQAHAAVVAGTYFQQVQPCTVEQLAELLNDRHDSLASLEVLELDVGLGPEVWPAGMTVNPLDVANMLQAAAVGAGGAICPTSGRAELAGEWS